MLMGGYTLKSVGKRRKLRREIQLLYFLCKSEYKICKLGEITIRRGLRQKVEK
jgi:hypothetical protein